MFNHFYFDFSLFIKDLAIKAEVSTICPIRISSPIHVLWIFIFALGLEIKFLLLGRDEINL
jgi:hypothetical protein